MNSYSSEAVMPGWTDGWTDELLLSICLCYCTDIQTNRQKLNEREEEQFFLKSLEIYLIEVMARDVDDLQDPICSSQLHVWSCKCDILIL